MPILAKGKETAILSGLLVAFLISTNLITLCIRRLHDMNLSGWLVLLAFLPGIGEILALFLYFWPGTKGKNRFGDQPAPASKGYYFMFLLYPLIFLIIILLAYSRQ